MNHLRAGSILPEFLPASGWKADHVPLCSLVPSTCLARCLDIFFAYSFFCWVFGTETETETMGLYSGQQTQRTGTWPLFIVDFPIESGDLNHSYVNHYQRVMYLMSPEFNLHGRKIGLELPSGYLT